MCLYVQEGNNKKASLYAHLPFTKCYYLYNTLFNAADCMKFGCLLGGWMDGWRRCPCRQQTGRQAGQQTDRRETSSKEGTPSETRRRREGPTDTETNGADNTAPVPSWQRLWAARSGVEGQRFHPLYVQKQVRVMAARRRVTVVGGDAVSEHPARPAN